MPALTNGAVDATISLTFPAFHRVYEGFSLYVKEVFVSLALAGCAI
jgi:hypothetical protein